jgi:hypothetical protein
MTLAPGVEFFEDAHEYWYKGRRLSGVTGLISKTLNMKMPSEFVEEHRLEGVHVHKAIQQWIETGDSGSIHPGVAWLTSTIRQKFGGTDTSLYSEVLVSDLSHYCSAVDIVVEYPGKVLDIIDTKKGVFKREYVSYQLGIYRYLIETHTPYTVQSCHCACLRDREYYPIIPVSPAKVLRVLYH